MRESEERAAEREEKKKLAKEKKTNEPGEDYNKNEVKMVELLDDVKVEEELMKRDEK